MTIASTIIKNIYTGNGSASAYEFDFKIFNDTEIAVWERASAAAPPSADTLLTLTTDYSVPSISAGEGGSVLLTGGALDSPKQVLLKLDTPYSQGIDLQNNSTFDAETLEKGLDRGVLLAQLNQGDNDISVRVGEFQSAAPTFPAGSANGLVGYAANGTDLELKASINPGSAAIGAYMTGLLNTGDAASTKEYIEADPLRLKAANSTVAGAPGIAGLGAVEGGSGAEFWSIMPHGSEKVINPDGSLNATQLGSSSPLALSSAADPGSAVTASKVDHVHPETGTLVAVSGTYSGTDAEQNIAVAAVGTIHQIILIGADATYGSNGAMWLSSFASGFHTVVDTNGAGAYYRNDLTTITGVTTSQFTVSTGAGAGQNFSKTGETYRYLVVGEAV